MMPGDVPRQHSTPWRVMDLFAGCGGFTEGFRSYANADGTTPHFRSVVAVEFDRAAAATYEANHQPDKLICDDIADFDPQPFSDDVDVITGGPPCQGYSGLGQGNPNDPRNALWEEYLRVVAGVWPKIFVMENVDRFLKSREYDRLQDATRPGGLLEEYALSTKTLNAADYGVPQARKRVIVLATRRDLGAPLRHPVPTHTRFPLIKNDFVLFDGTADLPQRVPVDVVFDQSARLAITGTELPDRRTPEGLPGPYRTAELHFGRTPTPLSIARYAAIPPGGNRHDLTGKWAEIEGRSTYLSTQAWDQHRSGSADVMGRLRWGAPSVTIRTEFYKPEKGRYLHPHENRPITHYEAALIQGFPEDYRWHGTKSSIAKQIGNAVPVGLARALAGAIHQRLSA
ncbi:cytosine-specific methyltransferase [Streptomyces kronopolitis]|uniref:Cytosine-specific methyltransferase n=1 Tax=Streptomyces kronopolitis TaxID=1612435 RepID=A0ABQ2JD36_9ACTN|nr:DNA cytosine methyltransferase [Streptomyces kronopolitis]GGN42869.1 cytosine-specific methyltransferase [Streptomyces kronopolitis]